MTQVLMGRPLSPANALEESVVFVDSMDHELCAFDLYEVRLYRRLVARSIGIGCPELAEIANALVAHDLRENRLHRELRELSAVLGAKAC
jgi:hypothetical protein